MIETHDSPSYETFQEPDTILSTITRVIHLCQIAAPDPAVKREIDQLESLLPIIEQHWPLTPEQKGAIDLGPFAAKNIADWEPELADTLMRLDYAIQHDGAAIEKVMPGSSLSSLITT